MKNNHILHPDVGDNLTKKKRNLKLFILLQNTSIFFIIYMDK